MAVLGYLLWSFASALIGGVVALALNKWAAGWSLVARILVAVAASVLPTFGVVAYLAYPGMMSFLMSPDEFLIPFALQILLIVVVSTPVVWLISRRDTRSAVFADAFD